MTTEQCSVVYRDLHDYQPCTYKAGHTGPHSFTNSTPQPASEPKEEWWRKAPSVGLRIDRKYPEGMTSQYFDMPEWLVDTILSDHAQAARTREMEDDIGSLLDCVVWMSGSGDFGPEGRAGEGWRKYRDEVIKPIMKKWVDKAGVKPGPLLASHRIAQEEAQ